MAPVPVYLYLAESHADCFLCRFAPRRGPSRVRLVTPEALGVHLAAHEATGQRLTDSQRVLVDAWMEGRP
jgi:hypothetical protein